MKTTAIVLAAGKGSRMKSDTPKQFLEIKGKPIIYYSLKAFEESKVDEIIIVTISGMEKYIEEEIVKKYSFAKVRQVVAGSVARCLSVYNGLEVAKETDYVLVHDSARPLISVQKINEIIDEVQEKKAVIVAVKVKDTIKQVDFNNCVVDTPDRNSLVAVQTPQAFDYKMLLEAYGNLDRDVVDESITDDACVWERYRDEAVYVMDGEETNIKITTPEDIYIGENLLNKGV